MIYAALAITAAVVACAFALRKRARVARTHCLICFSEEFNKDTGLCDRCERDERFA